MLRVGLVGGPRQQDDTGADEAGEVVDVAVRLVVVDAVAEPDHALDAEIVPQVLLDLSSRELGVAVVVEQALFGREQRPSPSTWIEPPSRTKGAR